MKYWIVVASKDHVWAGLKGNFCQACHGKRWPMEKMYPGDGVIFYSSKEKFGSSTPYQKFTAIGKVKEGAIYQAEINTNFKPFRRAIDFKNCRETPIRPLLNQLHFVEDPNRWGYKLMRGFLEIDRHDFNLIAGAILQQ